MVPVRIISGNDMYYCKILNANQLVVSLMAKKVTMPFYKDVGYKIMGARVCVCICFYGYIYLFIYLFTPQRLKEKAAFRNPDEFYFKMIKSRTVDGVHKIQ